MDYLTLGMIILAGLFGTLLITLLKVVNRLAEANKQLLIVVAGKDQKPESLRALVASAKPPQGNIKGIAGDKKDKGKKPENTNYTMEIGVK